VSSPLRLATGRVFAGDFKVLRPLRSGGQGSLYVVDQLSTGRQRALKLMLPDLVAQPASRKRFELEAKIAARIRSDHVVESIASGVDPETGTPWLVMELLEGEDLGLYLKRKKRLSAPSVLEIYSQLCHALGEAHRQGIVHRDLKPENVFLAAPRRRGVPFMVKVLDFGIARVVAESTISGATAASLGTPMWMAPEQTMPGGPIAPSTDVWPLGLLAFRMLTGYHVWKALYDPGASVMMLMAEAFMHPMPSASERAEHYGCNASLPPGFDAWFAKCVARAMEDRYPDAAEAFGALEPLLVAFGEETPAPSVQGVRSGSPPMSFDRTTPEPLSAPQSATPDRDGGFVPQPPRKADLADSEKMDSAKDNASEPPREAALSDAPSERETMEPPAPDRASPAPNPTDAEALGAGATDEPVQATPLPSAAPGRRRALAIAAALLAAVVGIGAFAVARGPRMAPRVDTAASVAPAATAAGTAAVEPTSAPSATGRRCLPARRAAPRSRRSPPSLCRCAGARAFASSRVPSASATTTAATACAGVGPAVRTRRCAIPTGMGSDEDRPPSLPDHFLILDHAEHAIQAERLAPRQADRPREVACRLPEARGDHAEIMLLRVHGAGLEDEVDFPFGRPHAPRRERALLVVGDHPLRDRVELAVDPDRTLGRADEALHQVQATRSAVCARPSAKAHRQVERRARKPLV
jgi:serine/threonine protein kinase